VAPVVAFEEPVKSRTLRSLPNPSREVTLAARIAAWEGDSPAKARPDRLSAVGSRRPGSAPATPLDAPKEPGPEVTMLAIGVLVRASERLLPGSRYLIARTHDRLRIIGPIEASDQHVELDVPLAGIEANFIADRLVITGTSDDTRRSFLLAFQSIASMTGAPVDEAIMEMAAPIAIAAYRP
jgi:hypothetical protein